MFGLYERGMNWNYNREKYMCFDSQLYIWIWNFIFLFETIRFIEFSFKMSIKKKKKRKTKCIRIFHTTEFNFSSSLFVSIYPLHPSIKDLFLMFQVLKKILKNIIWQLESNKVYTCFKRPRPLKGVNSIIE